MSSKKPETVQVIVRTRPTSNFAHDNLNIDIEKHRINVHKAKDDDAVNNQIQDWQFDLSKVLHNAGQELVYDTAARDIVDSVLEGYNGTLMAYGQTGAGKTFTMTGGSDVYKHRGIIPRAIGHIFRGIQARPETETVVWLSYLEIYNEQFYDLLREDGGAKTEMGVRDEAGGRVVVKGLSKVEAATEEAALNFFFEGETNRAMAEHQLNINSTRSHCVFTIFLESRSRIESSEKVISSKLNLVDLAGSERVGKTGSTGKTLKEAKYINKSLSFLEQVVLSLANKNRDHVPFRQSKLTNVLRDSLGGNCKTRMIANIWAEKAQLEETISTLKFATRMMKLSNEATVNIKMDPVMLVKKYEKEIRELKQELAMHDTLSNRVNVQYETYTPEQQAAIRKTVNSYVKGEGEIDIVNIRQIKEVFFQMKSMILDLQLDLENGGGSVSTGSSNKASSEAGSAGSAGQMDASDGDLVGEVDQAAGGFHLGQAPSDARPSGVDVIELTGNFDEEAVTVENSKQAPPARVPVERPDETVAFEEFKQNDGRELQQAYENNKKLMQQQKQQFRKISSEVNRIKRQLDNLQANLKEKEKMRVKDRANVSGVEVIDEEEYQFIRERKNKSNEYNTAFSKRAELSEQLTYTKGLVEQSKMALCNAFLEWYTRTYPTEGTEGAEEDEVLDDGEQFDRLERERVMQEDPESVSFYNARKTMNNKHKHKRRQH
jgi:kinesin family protein 6/9